MCLLSFLPPDIQPDVGALHNGTIINHDGHGFAIVHDDTILVERSLDAGALIEAFAVARSRYPHGPALFHSRMGTHGDNGIGNCHPFAVGGDERTVIAHNGILPAATQPARGDARCDTRIAAEELLPSLGSLRSRRMRLQVSRWMGRHNKIVVLSVDRRFREQAYILNEEAGIWHEGVWYSNDHYLPLRRSGWWERRPAQCPDCRTPIDAEQEYCLWCGWCLDCDSAPAECICWSPAALDRAAHDALWPGEWRA